LVQLATGSEYRPMRRDALRTLRDAPPSQDVRNALMSLFSDDDGDIRREAGNVLVELSRRHSECAAAIEIDLARACTDRLLSEKDGIYFLAGWDYAFEALTAHVGSVFQTSAEG
ncbi:MAG: hypothetical protein ACRDP6_16970, partial [Actinoallomurus sp.]